MYRIWDVGIQSGREGNEICCRFAYFNKHVEAFIFFTFIFYIQIESSLKYIQLTLYYNANSLVYTILDTIVYFYRVIPRILTF